MNTHNKMKFKLFKGLALFIISTVIFLSCESKKQDDLNTKNAEMKLFSLLTPEELMLRSK